MVRSRGRINREDEANPYIAFADVCVSLVLILVVLLAMGQLGRGDDRYLNAQREFERAVSAMPRNVRPEKVERNDPPGAQRWAYLDRTLFTPGNKLTPLGGKILGEFAKVLKEHRGWKRIRIEGHAMPSPEGEPDNWASSAAVAAITAELFQAKANIQPWMLAVAGRGGQTPYYKVFVSGYSSQEGRSIAQWLDAQGVRFSRGEDDDPPAILVAKNLGVPQAARFDVAAYRRNLRIEIVVEFLSTQLE